MFEFLLFVYKKFEILACLFTNGTAKMNRKVSSPVADSKKKNHGALFEEEYIPPYKPANSSLSVKDMPQKKSVISSTVYRQGLEQETPVSDHSEDENSDYQDGNSEENDEPLSESSEETEEDFEEEDDTAHEKLLEEMQKRVPIFPRVPIVKKGYKAIGKESAVEEVKEKKETGFPVADYMSRFLEEFSGNMREMEDKGRELAEKYKKMMANSNINTENAASSLLSWDWKDGATGSHRVLEAKMQDVLYRMPPSMFDKENGIDTNSLKSLFMGILESDPSIGFRNRKDMEFKMDSPLRASATSKVYIPALLSFDTIADKERKKVSVLFTFQYIKMWLVTKPTLLKQSSDFDKGRQDLASNMQTLRKYDISHTDNVSMGRERIISAMSFDRRDPSNQKKMKERSGEELMSILVEADTAKYLREFKRQNPDHASYMVCVLAIGNKVKIRVVRDI